LETLFDESVSASPTEDLMKRVTENYDCPLWIVTDGESEIWTFEAGGQPQAIQPPIVECLSPIGCGDVFFATLLDQQYNHPDRSLESAIELAANYASRNAASTEVATFSLELNR
jgi:sugar/nucleoside kinase (ribokinase family)